MVQHFEVIYPSEIITPEWGGMAALLFTLHFTLYDQGRECLVLLNRMALLLHPWSGAIFWHSTGAIVHAAFSSSPLHIVVMMPLTRKRPLSQEARKTCKVSSSQDTCLSIKYCFYLRSSDLFWTSCWKYYKILNVYLLTQFWMNRMYIFGRLLPAIYYNQ